MDKRSDTSEPILPVSISRRRITLLDRSSIGTHAWIDCPVHGHTARDPDTHLCVECPHGPT